MKHVPLAGFLKREKRKARQTVDLSEFHKNMSWSVDLNYSQRQPAAVRPLDMAICMVNNWMPIWYLNGLQKLFVGGLFIMAQSKVG